jgi:SAM-dependent methyltransferase
MIAYEKLADLYDRIFSDESYYRRYERFILRATGLRRGRVLDLACGTGRLGARLIRRGFDVTGVDRSPAMLARARRRGLAVHRGSIESFRLSGFDLAVCTFDSLNHLDRLDRVFSCASRALRPGGWFVFDLNTPYKINVVCAGYRGRRFRVGRAEVFWLNESAPDRWTSHLYIFDDGRRFEETIRERAFPQGRVDRWLRSCGLQVRGVYSDLAFGPVQPASERWYYVVKKHGSGNSGKNRGRARGQ